MNALTTDDGQVLRDDQGNILTTTESVVVVKRYRVNLRKVG